MYCNIGRVCVYICHTRGHHINFYFKPITIFFARVACAFVWLFFVRKVMEMMISLAESIKNVVDMNSASSMVPLV